MPSDRYTCFMLDSHYQNAHYNCLHFKTLWLCIFYFSVINCDNTAKNCWTIVMYALRI